MTRIAFPALTTLTVLAALGALPAPARATSVGFSTVNSQLCFGAVGCGVNSQSIGGQVLVSFVPVALSTVDASSPTFASLGALQVSCVGGGTGCGSQSLAGLNVYINVAQSQPSVGFGSFGGGAMVGSLSGTASSALVSWAPNSAVTIGPVTYDLFSDVLALVPPSTGGGLTSVNALVSAVPEPGTVALWALGLAGLGALRRRPRAQPSQA